jgi:hypothetical protein
MTTDVLTPYRKLMRRSRPITEQEWRAARGVPEMFAAAQA